MSPKWTKKDQRRFEHIEKSAIEQGKNTEKAKELAARTVNKQRREEGRTPSATSQGTGNPNSSLESRSRLELYNRAKQLRIKGRSKLDKAELVAAIRDHS